MAVSIPFRIADANGEEVIIPSQGKYLVFPKKVEPLQPSTVIAPIVARNLNDYVLVRKGNRAFSALGTRLAWRGHIQEDALKAVLTTGFAVPITDILLSAYRAIYDASYGRDVLYNARGELLLGKRVEQHGRRLHDFASWTCEYFVEGSGFLGLDLMRATGIDGDGSLLWKRAPLERCCEYRGGAELASLNTQGFPQERAQIMEQGKTISYAPPRAGRAVSIWSRDGDFDLDCTSERGLVSSELGILPVVEDMRN